MAGTDCVRAPSPLTQIESELKSRCSHGRTTGIFSVTYTADWPADCLTLVFGLLSHRGLALLSRTSGRFHVTVVKFTEQRTRELLKCACVLKPLVRARATTNPRGDQRQCKLELNKETRHKTTLQVRGPQFKCGVHAHIGDQIRQLNLLQLMVHPPSQMTISGNCVAWVSPRGELFFSRNQVDQYAENCEITQPWQPICSSAGRVSQVSFPPKTCAYELATDEIMTADPDLDVCKIVLFEDNTTLLIRNRTNSEDRFEPYHRLVDDDEYDQHNIATAGNFREDVSVSRTKFSTPVLQVAGSAHGTQWLNGTQFIGPSLCYGADL